MAAAELVFNLIAKTTGFQKSMAQAGKELTKLGKNMQTAGKTLTKNVSLPIAAIGTAAFASAVQFQNAMKTIRTGTGATGDVLAGLEKDFRAVFSAVPESADKVATAIADLNTGLGLQGVELQEVAKQSLELARITGTDLSSNIQSLIQLGNQWQISTENLSISQDFLYKASQATGIGIGQLQSLMSTSAPVLQAFGFSFEESAALLSKFNKEGVNTSAVLAGLKIAIPKLTEAGVPLREGFEQIADRIKNAGTEAQATQLAMEAFGGRAGNELAIAIRSGRFEIDELINSLENSSDSISKTAKDTEGFSEKLGRLRNVITTALEPLGSTMLTAIEPIITRLADAIKILGDRFASLDKSTQTYIVTIGALLTILGPTVLVVGKIIGSIGILLKAMAGTKIAFTSLTSVIVFFVKGGLFVLTGALAALLTPIGLVIAAIGAIGTAIYIWRDDLANIYKYITDWTSNLFRKFLDFEKRSREIFSSMMQGIVKSMVGGFTELTDYVGGKIDTITGFFGRMYDRVVGNSYIPDMMERINQEFGRLDDVMSDPAQKATNKTEAAFMQLGRGIGDIMNQLLGRVAGTMNEIANLMTGTTLGIGGAIAQIFSAVSGGGPGGGILGQVIGSLQGGASILSSIFGGGRPEGLEGPLLESGKFFEGLFGGAGTFDAFFAAADSIFEGVSQIGKGTVSTAKGIGQAAGSALGAYFGGPIGAKLGGILGDNIGKGIGKAIKKVFGSGSQNPATIARREFETQLNNLIDGKNIKIFDVDGNLKTIDAFNVGAKQRWNQANWHESFKSFAGEAASAFSGVAFGLSELFGITEDVAEQMAFVLAENLGGEIKNLGMLLTGLDIPIEKFEETMLKALENGKISIREYVVLLQGIREGYKAAEEAAKDVGLAMDMLIASGGDSVEAIRYIKVLAEAAKSEGINSINELVAHMVASGKVTQEQANSFFSAMAAFGIKSMDDLLNASTETIAFILAHLSSIAIDGGADFFDLSKAAKESFKEIEKESEKTYRILTDRFGKPITGPVIPNAKGNVFSSGSVIPFANGGAFGGVVNRPQLFNIGSMAERGPEAIMPLERLPDGRLGVLSAASSDDAKIINNYNITGSRHDAEAIKREIEKFNDIKNRTPGRFN